MPSVQRSTTHKNLKQDYLTLKQTQASPEDSFESLKHGLSFLITRYFDSQSKDDHSKGRQIKENQGKAIASKIVEQLERMLSHHEAAEFPVDRCSFYRLIRYWRAMSI